MLSIRSTQDLERALEAPLDPIVRNLLTLRRDQLLDGTTLDLGDVVHFIVACRDTLEAVEAEAGVAIGTSIIDGKRFPQRAFVPWFEYVERHGGGWLEAVTITDDDGFALVLFVADCVRSDPNLLLLLRRAMT